MAGPPLGVTVDLREMTRALSGAAAAAGDLRPVFRGAIAPSIAGNLEQQFVSRGAWLGTPWPRLSQTTIRLRTRTVTRRGGAKATTSRVGRARAGFTIPMQDTRRLFGSLVRLSHPEGVRAYEPERLTWGTTLPYAALHHREGGFPTRLFGRGPVRQVPARPVIPAEWPSSLMAIWAGQISAHLGDA
jgi:hypothetical protein